MGSDPVVGAVLVGLLAAPLGALRARTGYRLQGAAGAAAIAAVGSGVLAAGDASLAAGVAAAGAVLLPGSLGGWRRGTFDAAFGRAAFTGGRAEAVLPGALARAAPSVQLDPTARLRLERRVLEIEEKASAELVVTVLQHSGDDAAARWRCAAWLALVAGAAAASLPGAPGALGWSATAVGGMLGLAAARVGAVRRLLSSTAALEERVAEAAWHAFAHAGLTRVPGRCGVLLFATLFERRVVVLGDEGIDRRRGPTESWQDAADAVAREADLATGLEAGIGVCGELIARHAPPRTGPPPDTAPPIRIQD